MKTILTGVISEYRTISYISFGILASTSPVEFYIRERNTSRKLKGEKN